MDIQQLRVFRSAAKTGGFTRASEKLNLSQSTVSQHIKQLEDDLGCQLFLRVGKRVYLSEAGRVLLQYSDKIFYEIKNAEMAVRELSAAKRGTIRLGAGATTLTYLLPKILGEYKRKYPQIELIIVTGTSEMLLEAIQGQAVDLAIIMPLMPSTPTIRITPLAKEELVVVLNRKHTLTQKKSLDATDLKSLDFILYQRNTAMQDLVDRYFAALGVVPRITMELENIEAIKSLVEAGLGSSVLPLCSVVSATDQFWLRSMRVKGLTMERDLALASLNSELQPVVIKNLIAQIITGFAGKGIRKSLTMSKS